MGLEENLHEGNGRTLDGLWPGATLAAFGTAFAAPAPLNLAVALNPC